MADDDMDIDDANSTKAPSFDWSTPLDELDFEDPSAPEFGGRDAVIFAIDMSKKMFESLGKEDNNMIALKKAVEATRKSVVSKIFSQAGDYVGVLLYNTAKKSGVDFEHVFLLQELHQPGADIVKKLDHLLELGPDGMKEEYGSTEKCSIADLFWACSSLLSKVTAKLSTRRIMLFTAEEDPHRNNPNLKQKATQKAIDIGENNVDVNVYPISTLNNEFDPDKFWNDIELASASSEQPKRKITVTRLWEELEEQVRKRSTAKRAMARIPLVLANGLELSVGVYNRVQVATKSAAVKLFRETNETVQSETYHIEQVGASLLLPSEIKKYMTFAGRKITFTQEEVDSMKRFGPASLKLIALRSLNMLKEKYHIRAPQFIYPDEKQIKGSTKLFQALHKKCMDKDLIALCLYIARENIMPRFVALAPSPEKLDDVGTQLSPPGFNILFLPFADDLRNGFPVYRGAPVADKPAVQLAEKLVTALTRSYNPESFSNPVLQKHNLNIEALALDYDEEKYNKNKPEDTTIPHLKGIEKKGGQLMRDFVKAVYDVGYDPLKAAPKKRYYPKEKGEKEEAKAKKKATDPNLSVDDQITAAAEAGTLKKFTVAVLKEYCTKHKIKPDGTKKDDLIGAIETHLAGND